MREPSDDEFAAFDAVAFQNGRFPRSVEDRLGESRRDGRRPRRRLGTATDSGAVLAASAATATTTSGDAVSLVVVVVVDDELARRRRQCRVSGNSDDWRKGRGKLVRRRQKEFLENGRAGRISFVVDGQRFGGRTMFGPAASERFVEGAPGRQDFRRHVIPPAGQEWSSNAGIGRQNRWRSCKSAPGRRSVCWNLIILFKGSRADSRRDGRGFSRSWTVTRRVANSLLGAALERASSPFVTGEEAGQKESGSRRRWGERPANKFRRRSNRSGFALRLANGWRRDLASLRMRRRVAK